MHGLESAEDVGAVPPHGGMGCHACRLVDDDDVLVLIEQPHSLNRSGEGLGGAGVRQVDFKELTRTQTS